MIKNVKSYEQAIRENKSALMDYIMGRSDVNPLSDIKKPKKVFTQNIVDGRSKKEVLATSKTKVCRCCGEEKPKTEFYIRNKSSDKLQDHCKTCQEKRIKGTSK
jgi:hypothetical protein